MKVDNKSIIRKLTWRHLAAGRFRNLMAILAIALTGILFTSIATMSGAMIQSIEETTFRQVGTSAHGGFKYLNEKEYQAIKAAGGYQDISTDIILGFGENKEFAKKQHELRYAEDKKAKWGFSYPTVGTMPKEYREIALSTLTLDLLGLPHQLGQTIHLDYRVGEQHYSDDFILSGYWPGDDVMQAVQCYLSKEYVRDCAPDPGDNRIPTDFTGTISADVWFRNSADIETKLEALAAAAGLDPKEIRIGVNWGYTDSGDFDLETALMVGSIVFLVMLSGYLIIYSIFSISVAGEIRFYGLLKTIGTTGRQIRRIVRGQALVLSAVGIPIGLVLGFFLGSYLAPVMMAAETLAYDAPERIKAEPWIFILAALFSLLTVFISCRKPGRRAAAVTPIEALGYTESSLKSRRKEKKSGKVTVLSMAWSNVRRAPGKLVVVLLSLSLSMVLLNGVVTLVSGFDMNAYMEMQVVADFYLTDGAVMNAAADISARDFAAISPELEAEAEALPGLQNSGRVYYLDQRHNVRDERILQRLERLVAPDIAANGIMADSLKEAIAQKYIDLQIYGLDQWAYEKIEKNYQNIDWEKFASGKYALIETYDGSSDEEQAFYRIGDKILLEDDQGKTSEYEILGYIEYPHAMSSQFAYAMGTNLVLPANEFLKLFKDRQPFSLLLDVADEETAAAEAWAEQLTEERMSNLTYRSQSFYMGEFKEMQYTFLVLGGVLAGVLAVIGILNFINTMSTSIITRKRELAMLQSIGMTNVQMKKMLILEGVWYAALTLAFSLLLAIAVNEGVIRNLAVKFWFFSYQSIYWPILIAAPILLLLCTCVPLICGKMLARNSIVERLHEN